MRRLWSRRLAGMTGSLLLAAPLVAGRAEAAAAETDDASQRLYVHYCGSCHGKDGKGDGALAPILNVTPVDLTQLAARNDGVFSYTEVMRSVDGRKTVRAHGKTDMPVWGAVFVDDPTAPLSDQLAGAGRLFLILQHLESIQEKPSGDAP